MSDHSRLLEEMAEAAREAGAAILEVVRRGFEVETKGDSSPVTIADRAAELVILSALARAAPGVPVIAEEEVAAGRIPAHDDTYFLVDPLDGTKEFVVGRDEYTVNIALVTEGVPLLGIIGAPAFGWLWRGLVGRGAERLRLSEAGAGPPEPIHTRAFPKRGEAWIAAVSRSHADVRTEAFIDARPGAVRAKLGSAVKFGRLAEGAADIYPRLGPTSEWDVAAGCAVVTAAGGKVTDVDGRPLRFGERQDGFIVPAFIAWGDPSAAV